MSTTSPGWKLPLPWSLCSIARQVLDFLAEHPRQAQQAFIVCRCRHPLRLHDKIMALPWFCL